MCVHELRLQIPFYCSTPWHERGLSGGTPPPGPQESPGMTAINFKAPEDTRLTVSASSISGEVCYRSKYLQSDTYTANIEANKIVVSEFGTMAYPDPCKNIFSK